MKKLLLILVVLALPSVSLAQEVIVSTEPGPSPKSWLLPDIFHRSAEICQAISGCVADDVVNLPGSFVAHITHFPQVVTAISAPHP